MVRSLWTAASGMKAQQTNVDTISNNLANINTIGYKKQTTEFKSLLYQTLQQKTTAANGEVKPVVAQVGLGVRNSAIVSRFEQGPITNTGNELDLAIAGNGFYAVRLLDGTTGYTRSGAFMVSLSDGKYMITTSEGYPLLDDNKNVITIDKKYDMSNIVIDGEGNISAAEVKGKEQSLGIRIGLFQFLNPAGLLKTSDSILEETVASGTPVGENIGTTISSNIRQGYLEQSNVQAVDEMVNLIVAQRAYEMNSKAITASDDMLQQANGLRN